MSKRRNQGEGTVYFDPGRKRWVGQVWIDGRRRKVSARTKTDATAALGRLLHGGDDERHADRRATVRSLLADWQAKSLAGRDLAPSTLEIHRWAIATWTTEIGSVRLTDLTVTHVEKTLGRLAKGGKDRKPLGKSALVKMRSTLNQALAWAERRRAIGHNPAASAELPADIIPSGERVALEPDELGRLLKALDGNPWQAMYALMGRVGLRPGEAAAVCADAVDLDAQPPTVAVIRSVQLHNGRPVLSDSLKTAGARRRLAIPADLADLLLDAIDRHPSGLLFRGPDDGPAWPTTVRSVLTAASRDAGLDHRVKPNELRHTAATILANAGLAPHHVADILGHRSTRMVDAVYRHRPAVILGAETQSSPTAQGRGNVS